MSYSFANLKRNSDSNIEKLQKAVESMTKSNSQSDDDDRYWKPSVDKSGNGYFLIRFLPSPPQDGEDGVPLIKYYDHGFQGPTGLWYIEKSLTTLGQPDPLTEYNSELWESGIEANKELARKQKRRLHFVSNIYVIKDPKNPENEGKVKLFTYGSKILEKIQVASKPIFEDVQPIYPFHFWKGATFKLKIRKVDGYQNYDFSEFDTQSPLFDDDSLIEEVWNSEYSLQEIISPKNFKTYDELKARLHKVINVTSPNINRDSTINAIRNQKIVDKEDEMSVLETAQTSNLSQSYTDISDEDVSELDYFKNLLDD